jgi:hypothetical protein
MTIVPGFSIGATADQGVGHRQDHDLRVLQCGLGAHAVDVQFLLQARSSAFTGLDVAHGVCRADQVLRKPDTHLPARAEQRDGRLHDPVSCLMYGGVMV